MPSTLPLVLAAVHRLDAGAEDLGEVRRVVQREGDHGGREIRQADADHRHERQGEVDEQQLQHQRRAAHQPDIAVDQARQRAPARDARQRQHQAQRHRQASVMKNSVRVTWAPCAIG